MIPFQSSPEPSAASAPSELKVPIMTPSSRQLWRNPTPPRSVWTLPEDGIIDHLAIEIAATGERPVALTSAERQLAAERIIVRGGTAWQITCRLHVSHSTARRMAAAIRRTAADAVRDAA